MLPRATGRRSARGDLLVTDIGYRCGFGNPTHFSASFRKVTGQSRQSFRRR